MLISKHHDGICEKWSGGKCPCLTCIYDTHTGSPNSATKCCDLIKHRLSCVDETPCADYEREDYDENGYDPDRDADDE